MDNSIIIKALRESFGIEVNDGVMYGMIDEWAEWYSGNVRNFHTVTVNNGVSVVERPMFRLRMAKRVAEDWANLLVSDSTEIMTNSEKSTAFLNTVFAENNFWTELNRLVEKSFALGTGAVVCRLENANVASDGRLLFSPDASVRFDYVTAQSIFPVSWNGDSVKDVAFASELIENGESIVYLQLHRLEEDGYAIYSRYYSEKGGLHEIDLPEGTAREVRTGSYSAWFSLIRPNIANSLDPSSPLGMSVYGDATDILRGIDLCYDSMNMEFYLGKKMVFMRRDLLETDSDGNYYAPQDSNRQLFMYIGDKTLDGDMLPQEFNPVLRVSDHSEALREQLGYLSAKCGFGQKHYRFDDSQAVTATQVISENSDMYRNVKKHELSFAQSLQTTAAAVLSIGSCILGIENSELSEVRIVFDDNIAEDDASQKKLDLDLIRAGIMNPFEYRMKYFGEDEEKARAMCKEGAGQ